MNTETGPTFRPPPDEQPCPFCAEQVKREAVKCRHCGENLGPGAAKRAGRIAGGRGWKAAFAGLLVVSVVAITGVALLSPSTDDGGAGEEAEPTRAPLGSAAPTTTRPASTTTQPTTTTTPLSSTESTPGYIQTIRSEFPDVMGDTSDAVLIVFVSDACNDLADGVSRRDQTGRIAELFQDGTASADQTLAINRLLYLGTKEECPLLAQLGR